MFQSVHCTTSATIKVLNDNIQQESYINSHWGKDYFIIGHFHRSDCTNMMAGIPVLGLLFKIFKLESISYYKWQMTKI